MKWKDNIGDILKQERKSWGMSRKRLARLAYVDRYTIEDIENGLIRNPNFFDMLNICDVLDSSVYFFLLDEKEDSYYGTRRNIPS